MNRENKKIITKTKLIKAATKEFARKGYARTNINEISLKAGYGKGTIYNYFQNKFSLFIAVVETTIADLVSEIQKNIEDVDDPVEKLKTGIYTDFRYFEKNKAIAAVILREGFSAEPKKQQEFIKAASPAFEIVNHLISDGMEKNLFRQDIDSFMATLLVIGMVENLVLMQDAMQSRFGKPEELAEMVIKAFIEGIQKIDS
jgi:TetR/AcrR family fatty acid metabolism transcriptional regulator